ncbi:LysR family transcriptional regulator [Marinobacterium mangrovicola]|uniref:LysR family transcriptional regulator n=1 Tax=Marinobacterium mangrovicola TaxID=1476959 RepID=A0A4R1GR54_9GAMM|nr:LysR family transcriptional regulator [Marinobacterium mangrovicola]TCK08659.1 LysR family transcriptional regulator [Marinobacterium mangrovicola]
MDKLKAMTTFVAIVDHGSMSAAAEQLSRSPAAVVRSLAELEKQLGVRLLNRSTRRLALTDEGRDYLQHCRQILADIDAAEFQLDSRRANPAGKLAITAPIMFGRLHIAPVLTQWLQQHPSMSAELTLLDRTVDLIEEGFDLALRIGRLADSSLVAKPVGAVKWVLCASPTLLESLQLKYGPIEQPDQLSQLPTLGFAAAGNQWQFNEHGRDLSVPVNPVFTCNQIDTLLQACRDGLGIIRVLSYQAQRDFERGTLVPLFPDLGPAPLPVQFVMPHNRLVSPRVRSFLNSATEPLQQRLTTVEATLSACSISL